MKTTKFFDGMLMIAIVLFSGCNDDSDSDADRHSDNPTTRLPTYIKNAKLKKVVAYTSKETATPFDIVEEYEYDHLGQISKVTAATHYNEYKYNDSGQLLKIINYHENTSAPGGFINLLNYIYTYSQEAKTERILKENGNGNLIEFTQHFYDEEKLTKTERYDAYNALEEFVVYEYNGDNQLVTETSYTSDQQPNVIITHTYSNGVNIRSDFHRANTKERIREIIRTFDANNNLIVLESNEINLWSAMQSFVLRYEYYDN